MALPSRHGRSNLQDCLADLDRDLLRRDAAVRLLLLIGPPGTAKCELARRLHRVFGGARYFERLLTRFSVPEELFGPAVAQGPGRRSLRTPD